MPPYDAVAVMFLRCGALVCFCHDYCLVGGGWPLISVWIGSRKGDLISVHVGQRSAIIGLMIRCRSHTAVPNLPLRH